jgi:hypothetical protein
MGSVCPKPGTERLNIMNDSTLIQRLRGFYAVPVNDGAGLLNGESTFVRSFPVPNICLEAANRIERLEIELQELKENERIACEV